ncbi:DUF1353 domain-containing protein [Variovorax sp. J2P1-59]|uniref:DUF1353 domain-containing protein n=1 Tax=Variovorax flavidus TaxID=3053501 RepID=UPI002577E06C|nr:DUF1353 domain-containing protein [Variovorax sp. J2P1-59]MDM0078953.1 DUF1353 domain-containing protein [Variovorax sp. J2P1-59]
MKTESSRRHLLQGGSGLLIALGFGALPVATRAEEPYSDPAAAERWLLPLLDAPGAVAGGLHMGRFRDRVYYLDKEIKWSPGPGQEGPTVVVPAGFVTDLASIPRVFWSLLPTDGAYTFPAIVHDYLYWVQRYPREVADSVFRYGMDDMKVSSTVSKSIYAAVRAGGGSAWTNNAKLKQSGEMRLLREFPNDPTISWNDWKQRKGCCAVI